MTNQKFFYLFLFFICMVVVDQESEYPRIRRYLIRGSRTLSNYWWALVTFFGGAGFLCTGVASYFQRPLFSNQGIAFFPQGLVMGFYGIVGLCFGLYLWFTLLWQIGSGFNEFNKETGQVRLFRWGFPGKNRRIDLSYSLADVQGIRVDIQEGLTPKRSLYLCLKGKGAIPLLRVTIPCPVEDIELQAADLAKFLQVSLEIRNS